MNLALQINTILFSFLFCIFFSFFLSLNEKYIYSENKIKKILITFLFVMINVLLYFIFLKKINNGIFHPYSFLLIFIGFFVGEKLQKVLKKNLKSKFQQKSKLK